MYALLLFPIISIYNFLSCLLYCASTYVLAYYVLPYTAHIKQIHTHGRFCTTRRQWNPRDVSMPMYGVTAIKLSARNSIMIENISPWSCRMSWLKIDLLWSTLRDFRPKRRLLRYTRCHSAAILNLRTKIPCQVQIISNRLTFLSESMRIRR